MHVKAYINSLIKIGVFLLLSSMIGLPMLIHSWIKEIVNKATDTSKIGGFIALIFLVLIIVIVAILLSSQEIQKEYESKSDKISIEIEKKELEMKKKLEQINTEYAQRKIELEKEWSIKHGELMRRLQDVRLMESEVDIIMEEKALTYPWLATLFADYRYIQDKDNESELRRKSRPAMRSADQISVIAREKREIQKLCKMYEYQLNYYEKMFPWLEDFKEVEPLEAWSYVENRNFDTNNEYETVKSWLSPEEYQNLSSANKWQLALDRYKKKKKTNWEIGIDYERYIGYLFEEQGFKVKYNGALTGLEDMGRDLIATRKNLMIVIQCKRWAERKEIHEKHVFQLYGSVVVLRTQNPELVIEGMLITTTKLSNIASECATYLDIKVNEGLTLESYPMIKCKNSAKGEMIFHLPFDQQYDKVQINSKKGDYFVATVAEAEELGFRHAYKWHGNNNGNNAEVFYM